MIYFIWESLFTSLVFENLALHVGWFIALNILNCTRHCFSESSEFLPAEFFYYHQLKLALPTLPWFYWAPSYPTFRINLVFSSFKGRNVQDEFVSVWFILPEDVDSKRREAVTQRRDVICRKKWFLDIWVIIDPWEHLKMLFIQWHFSIKLLTVEWEMNDDLIRKWQDGLWLVWRCFPRVLLCVLSKSTQTHADGNLVAAPHVLHLSTANVPPASFPRHDNQPIVTANTVNFSCAMAPSW